MVSRQEKRQLCKTTRVKMTRAAGIFQKRRGGNGPKPRREGNKIQIFRKKRKRNVARGGNLQENLRCKTNFRQKMLRIICAKGAFHFWENGVIMVTSYRGDVKERFHWRVIQNGRK